MSNDEAIVNVQSLLGSLSSSNDKTAVLVSARAALSLMKPLDVERVLPGVSFTELFNILGSNDREEVNACCDVLDKLFSSINVKSLLQKHSADISHALSHWSDRVKCLCLNQLLRACSKDSKSLIGHTDVMAGVAPLIGDESLEVAKKASDICLKLCENREGLQLVLTDSRVFPKIISVARSGDVNRYRIYDLIVSIALLSDDSLTVTHESQLLPQLLEELSSSDMLIRLNCIEQLATLAGRSHTLAYLKQHAVVSRLKEMLDSFETDPFGHLMLPGVVRFFGGVCRSWPGTMATDHSSFIELILSSVHEDRVADAMTTVAVETIGFVGESGEGKLALDKFGGSMQKCCLQVGKMLRSNCSSQLKTRCFEAISRLIRIQDPSITEDTAVSLISQRWFSSLSLDNNPATTLAYILSVAKQPFSDLRLASLGVLSDVAGNPWGRKLLKSEPGFVEYLLDRDTERSKEGLETKYSIVVALASAGDSVEVFGWEYVARFRSYVKEGVFYARQETQVALDNAD